MLARTPAVRKACHIMADAAEITGLPVSSSSGCKRIERRHADAAEENRVRVGMIDLAGDRIGALAVFLVDIADIGQMARTDDLDAAFSRCCLPCAVISAE